MSFAWDVPVTRASAWAGPNLNCIQVIIQAESGLDYAGSLWQDSRNWSLELAKVKLLNCLPVPFVILKITE